MNFFAYALYALGVMGSLSHNTVPEEAFLYHAKRSTDMWEVIEYCNGLCTPLVGAWEVLPYIVWENFHEDLVGRRLTHAQFIEATAQLGALKKDMQDHSVVKRFIVLTEHDVTGDATRDVQYLELKLKNIKGSDRNVEKYLKCCGAFQYDGVVPIYVKSAASTPDSLEL